MQNKNNCKVIDLKKVSAIYLISFGAAKHLMGGFKKIVEFEDHYEITIDDLCADFVKSMIQIEYKIEQKNEQLTK